MFLSDREMQAALRDRIIMIDPPLDERLYTSTALDLTLASVLLRWHEPGNHPSGLAIDRATMRLFSGCDRSMTRDAYIGTKVPAGTYQITSRRARRQSRPWRVGSLADLW